jgi:hypothetical protein
MECFMQQKRSLVSNQTRNNWLIDAGLFTSALAASISGVYFLFLPSNGYQGGRNPWHNIQILFDRHTWDNLHTWTGVVMIAAALIHLVIHWKWVVNMTRRMFNELTGHSFSMNPRGRWNLILNLVVALSFILTAASGIYFLFFSTQGRTAGPQILLTSAAWDLLHTWAGTILIASAIVHFAIHWRWVVNVSGKLIRQAWTSGPAARPGLRSENSI